MIAINQKIKVWQLFLIAIALNSIFGYIVGGVGEAGRYMGQTIVYGGLLIGAYYVVIAYYKSRKNRPER